MDKKQALLHIFVSIFFSIYLLCDTQNIDDPVSCKKDDMPTNEDHQRCCENLNKKRTTFYKCCQYPDVVIYRYQYNLCVGDCNDQGYIPNSKASNCCITACCFRYLGIFNDTFLKEGAIDPEGLKNSFLLAITIDWPEEKVLWIPPINNSVNGCYNLLDQGSAIPDKSDTVNYENFWTCEKMIPKYLYEIVDCSFNYNFFFCPVWNRENDDKCDITRTFVYDCYINGPSWGSIIQMTV